MGYDSPEEKWEEHYRKLEEWEKAFPESITVPGMKINYWASFAMYARQNGYSDREKDGGDIFRMRLKAAEGILLRKTKLHGENPFPCPGLYSASVAIARGLEWDEEMVTARLLRPVVKIHPRYLPIFRKCLQLHDYRNTGKKGGEQRFAATLMAMIGGNTGKEVYARLITTYFEHSYFNWDRTLVDEEAIKDGMIEAIKNNMVSTYYVGVFLSFAQKIDAQKEILRRAEEVAPELMSNFDIMDTYVASWKRY